MLFSGSKIPSVHMDFFVCTADHVSSGITIQPSIADVQEGQSLDLNCFAPGDPPPQVTWTRASGHLSSHHQVLQCFTKKKKKNCYRLLYASVLS